MLTTIQDPAFKLEADRAIFEFCPEVHELTYIEHGADNIVALVNKQYVFRFPRNEGSAKRLAYETALLQKIGSHITALKVPRVVKVYNRPLHTVSEYIEGEHLSGKAIQALTEVEQVAVGRQIAEFIVQLNQAISGLEVRRLRTEAAVDSLDEPWPTYFTRLFEQNRLPNEQLRPVVGQYYPLWKNYVQHERNTYTIHDDLHPSNLLFEGPRLTGVVDFGDTNVGSIESELRWLYLAGDSVLRSTIDHYQNLTGMQVNYDHVRVWAIMHELSSFTDRLARQQTDTFPFKRAQAHLREWISGFPL